MTKAPLSGLLKQSLNSKGKTVETEQAFLIRLGHECQRAERSGRRFVLVLIDGLDTQPENADSVIAVLAGATREIDFAGWYLNNSTIGVLFAELGDAPAEVARETLLERIKNALQSVSAELKVSAQVLPHDVNEQILDDHLERIYQQSDPGASRNRPRHLAMKRALDIIGSSALLILLSPLLALIALMVKLGSPGPVLFRQTRAGWRGRHFTFLKFRSMTAGNDPSVHEKYAKEFVRGTAQKQADENGVGVFKLTRDKRVTPLGEFLRKTSLDELPQLWNVLVGDMALVGPRPPIPYEVECYSLWHQRRILESKPGITGLWQVCGRSRTGFDDMVRLDLLYARTWTPWLDVKILLLTPLAVFGRGGAH